MNKKKKRVMEVVFDYSSEFKLYRNSLVSKPAVEYERLAFDKDGKVEELKATFSTSEQKFIGVSILADTPIPRLNQKTGEEYDIVFTKDVIPKIVNKFFMDGNQNNVDMQHSKNEFDGMYLVGSLIVGEGGAKCDYFPDVPEGSWITTYFVPDVEQYNRLLNDENFKGFSIDICAGMVESFEAMLSEYDDIEIEERIKEILFDENLSETGKINELKKYTAKYKTI